MTNENKNKKGKYVFLSVIVLFALVLVGYLGYVSGWNDKDLECQDLSDYVLNETLNNCVNWVCNENGCDGNIELFSARDTCFKIIAYGWGESDGTLE